MILNNKALWLRCSEWGSYIHFGDPGACMYSFNDESSFRDKAHAEAVIHYVENFCLPSGPTHVNPDYEGKDEKEGGAQDLEDLTNIVHTARAYLLENG